MSSNHRRSVVPAIVAKSLSVVAGIAVTASLLVALPYSADASTLVTNDSFTRTVATGWGSTSSGQVYTTSADTRAKLSVSNGAGSITSLAPGTSATITLASVSAQDVDVQSTVVVPAVAATLFQAIELRRQSDGSVYRGRVQMGLSGSVTLGASRVNGSVETDLGKVLLPAKATPSSSVSIQFRVTGTNPVVIAGRAWLTGSTVPAWQNVITDSSGGRIASAGAVGIWQYAGSGNANSLSTTFDNFVVTKDPEATGTTAPPTATPTPTPTSTPTTAPAPPVTEPNPVTTTGGTAGSATVGTASYSVPSGAIYIAVSGGSDANSGSVSSPLKTVGAAIAKASSGQTLVLRQGIYHEAVTIPSNKALTIQSYPKEMVWFDGSSQITSWSQSGSTWRTTGFTFFPTSVMDGVADNPRFVDPNYPMAARPNQVFIDGTPLTQVSSAAKVVSGTFAVDAGGKSITIGSNPSGHEVRASDLEQAIAVLSSNSVLKGFGVRKYAPDYETRSAVRLGNTGISVQNLVVQDTAMIGINATNNDITIDHVSVTRSGLLGVGVNAAYNFKLLNSAVNGNNSEQFKAAPVSGGVKITRSRGVTVDNNNTSNNYGSGIWLDESCYDIRVTDNVSSGNQYTGIQLELSSNAIVANNETSNQQFGMQIIDTSNVKIYNNNLGNNSKFGVRLYQDERRNSNTSITGHDPRRPNPDSTVTWITTNIQVSNNAFGAGGSFQVYAFDAKTHIPASQMNITVAGNLLNQRTTNAQATLLGWGGNDNSTVARYDSVGAIQGLNSNFKNVETSSSVPLSSMSSAIAAAASSAVGLPSDVASAIGQSAGSKKVGRY